MKFNIKDCLLACVVSIVMFYIIVALVGIAAAVATPEGYFGWFRERELLDYGFYLWNAITIIPAQAIPAIVITYITARYIAEYVMFFCLVMVLIYAVYFVIYYKDFGSWGMSLIYPLAILLAGYFAHKSKMKKSMSN